MWKEKAPGNWVAKKGGESGLYTDSKSRRYDTIDHVLTQIGSVLGHETVGVDSCLCLYPASILLCADFGVRYIRPKLFSLAKEGVFNGEEVQ